MNRWELGGVKITRIVELETLSKGTFVLPDATLGNVKRDSALLMPHFADANGKMRMSVHALVVESRGQAHRGRYLHRQRQAASVARVEHAAYQLSGRSGAGRLPARVD